MMRALLTCAAVLGVCSPLFAATLTLERTILLPGVEGRIDHLSNDVAGGRLFVAALGNNTVEVVDLKAGKVVHSITGLAEPQGIYFLADLNRIFVANGGDGTVRIFDGSTFAPVTAVKFDDDADNVRYDPVAMRLYVGHGTGALGAIDVRTNEIITDTALSAHPESFQMEKRGSRVFVNIPNAHQVAVIDRNNHAVIATWSPGLAAANFPMALDEDNHRLMIGCRVPGRLLIFDTELGREVGNLPLHGDCDDLFFDPVRHRLYASCGEGFIDVFNKAAVNHYDREEQFATEVKARTCFVDTDHIYLAVPKRGSRPAQIQCYRLHTPPNT